MTNMLSKQDDVSRHLTVINTDLGRKVGVQPLETFVETQVVSDGVLPGHSDLFLLEVGEPLLDGQIDIM